MAQEESIIRLTNVRLSFPSLEKHEIYEGEDTGKFSATFLILQGSTNQEMVEFAINEAITGKWGKKSPSKKKLKTTYRDGDDEKYDGYAGMMALKGTNQKRVNLIMRDRTPVDPEMIDEWFYAGAYVNASLTFNAGKDSFGNYRVWCNLRAVQFFMHGERFGGGAPVDTESEFEEFDDEEIPEDMGV